jgi:hypothetical protein
MLPDVAWAQAGLVNIVQPTPPELNVAPNAWTFTFPQSYASHAQVQVGASKETVLLRPASSGNALLPHLSAPISSSDPSQPVKEFLRNHNLEALSDEFVNAGIKNGAALTVFKNFSNEDKEEFIVKYLHVDRLQTFMLRKFLKTAQ